MKSAKWENIFKGWNSTESATVHTLKQVPIFKDLTEKEFSELEKLIHHRNYSEGDYIFKNRATGEGMYIIMKGSVKITIGTKSASENILADLTEGDFFGELALFDDEPRSANAIATTDSELIGFFTADLLSLQDRHPELANKILFNLGGILGGRRSSTNHLLMEAQGVKDDG